MAAADPVPWTALTMQNGYIAYTQPVCRRDANGVVWLRGEVQVPAVAPAVGSVVFVIPAGLRPAMRAEIACLGNNNSLYNLEVQAGGNAIAGNGFWTGQWPANVVLAIPPTSWLIV